MDLGSWFSGGSATLVLEALKQSFAVIEFTPEGDILSANPSFCAAMGYAERELKGRHHRLFVSAEQAAGPDYAAFWRQLAAGRYDSGEYLRLAKGGKPVWLQASYTPVKNRVGKVIKVVKLALDITAAKEKAAEDASLIQAIFRSQAVIEFDTAGVILTANDNFLRVVGYGLDEIVGRHHRMFVDPAYAAGADYAQFWDRLRQGEFLADEFCRIGKNGQNVWLEASYNPVFDAEGHLTKVVKFATDLTERMRNVGMIGDALAQLAAGDLEARVEQPLIPSLDRLRVDFNAAAGTLHDALGVVANSAGAIRTGTGEIRASAEDLSKRTEQQAASLEETAAALDQITTTVRQTAESSLRARESAAAARDAAETSGRIVGDAVQAMDGIERSSREITQIIGVIDEIAFQTNLLALNAGVEAARAGDAGRGFAVVATEVRALAQRSAQAAKEIKGLIGASSREVTSGVSLVAQTGKALERIVTQVADINAVISEIAASAQEQSTALAEVNASVNHMDQMTQQNAAMVEQTTAASHGLADQGAELATLIGRFKLSRTQAGPTPAVRRPAPAARPRPAPPARRGSAAVKWAPQADEAMWEEF